MKLPLPLRFNRALGRTLKRLAAFTLIEILVVISIIAVLAALLFPAMGAVRTQARKASAKNDLTQLVNAVRNFQVDYGRYPLPTGSEGKFEGAGAAPLIAILTSNTSVAVTGTINPRFVRYIEIPVAKRGRGGLSGSTGSVYWLDPFGAEGGNPGAAKSEGYNIYIDHDYDDKVEVGNGYGTINTGVAAFSKGPDGKAGTAALNSDNVISWQ